MLLSNKGLQILLFVLISMLNSCCLLNVPLDNYVSGTIVHGTCTAPSSGSITQNLHPCFESISLGNRTYSWSDGSTDKDLLNVSPNYPADYKCDIGYSFWGLPWNIPKKYAVRYNTEWFSNSLIEYSNEYKTLYRNSTSPNLFGNIFSNNILPENGIGCIEFTALLSDGEGKVYIGFNNLNTPQQIGGPTSSFTGFELEKSFIGNTWTLYKNGIRLDNVNGSFVNGDVFQIKYANNIQFMQSGTIISIPGQYASSIILTHPAYRIQCQMKGSGITLLNILSTFSCTTGSDFYAELKKELDGTCYNMTGNVSFVYKEKYKDDVLNYTIYDWQRNAVLTSSILPTSTANETGLNYHVLAVGGALSDEYYTLEVVNSKGENYKMRFRYTKVLSTNKIYTLSPTSPGNPTVKPVYAGPMNYDPTIKVTTSISDVIDIQNGQNYE